MASWRHLDHRPGLAYGGCGVRTLSVIGVEDGAIVAADENGERFRIPVDESVRGRLVVSSQPPGKRLSPREIQAHVRAGLSVEEVAARTGAPVAYVERFVRPVLAERAFVLESAMRVTVQPDAEPEQASSFGAVLAERLTALDATEVSWTSLREGGGDWVVSVAFRADDVDHRARWTFDAKRLTLTPENVEAATLSQQGTPTALTPRLRAIEPTGPVPVPPPVEAPKEPDRSRFDSAAFELPDLKEGAPEQGPVEAAVLLDALARKRVEREAVTTGSLPLPRAVETPSEEDGTTADGAPQAGTVTRGRFPAPEDEPGDEPVPAADGESAEEPEDALPLRRPRDRGRRPEQQRRPEAPQRPSEAQPRAQVQQAAPGKPRIPQPSPSRQSQARHVEPAPTRPVPAPPGSSRARRGRTSLPSWDEIVFGKGDD